MASHRRRREDQSDSYSIVVASHQGSYSHIRHVKVSHDDRSDHCQHESRSRHQHSDHGKAREHLRSHARAHSRSRLHHTVKTIDSDHRRHRNSRASATKLKERRELEEVIDELCDEVRWLKSKVSEAMKYDDQDAFQKLVVRARLTGDDLESSNQAWRWTLDASEEFPGTIVTDVLNAEKTLEWIARQQNVSQHT